MLIVMEYRDFTTLDELLFYFKTLRRFNIFKVNTTERICNVGDGVDELFGSAVFHLYINSVKPCKAFKQ